MELHHQPGEASRGAFLQFEQKFIGGFWAARRAGAYQSPERLIDLAAKTRSSLFVPAPQHGEKFFWRRSRRNGSVPFPARLLVPLPKALPGF